jgi:hypothetical protein
MLQERVKLNHDSAKIWRRFSKFWMALWSRCRNINNHAVAMIVPATTKRSILDQFDPMKTPKRWKKLMRRMNHEMASFERQEMEKRIQMNREMANSVINLIVDWLSISRTTRRWQGPVAQSSCLVCIVLLEWSLQNLGITLLNFRLNMHWYTAKVCSGLWI